MTIRRALWVVVEYAAFALWLPAALIVDATERVMDTAYRKEAE